MRFIPIAFAVSLSAWPFAPCSAAQTDVGSGGPSLLGATIVDSPVQPKGALMNLIVPGGAAYKAGLLSGDVVTAIERKPVEDAETLARTLATHRAGDRIELTVAHLGAAPRPFMVVLAPPGSGAPARGPDAAWGEGTFAPVPVPWAPVAWVLFTDPVEHAFSIEVPAGWRVKGGVRRISQIEVRSSVQAVSPDGAISLFFGDNSIPAFIVPNPTLAAADHGEGSVYSPGPGQQLTVAPYLDGAAFASSWGARRIAQSCTDAKRLDARSLPEASRGFERAYAAEGIRASIHAGEASFNCPTAGRDEVGYVFAATELARAGSNATWRVKLVSGYTAPAAASARAAQLLSHVAASFLIDPAWMSKYDRTAAAAGRAAEESGKAMGEAVAEGYPTAARQWLGPGHATVRADGSTPPFAAARELTVVPSH